MSPRSQQTVLLFLAPLLVAVVLMLPRLADPHFGFFDDTSTIQIARRVLDGEWTAVLEGSRGRARPLYWLLYTAIYALAGARPFWFFLGNTILLCAIVVEVILLAQDLGADRRQASLAGLLFVLAGPVLENVYTLSKPELQQILWILLALLLAHRAGRWRGARRMAAILLGGLAVLAACNTKETTVLLLPISALWLTLGWGLRRLKAPGGDRGFLRDPALALACFGGGLVYLASSSVYLAADRLREGYASGFTFHLASVVANFRIWLDWLNRDYLYLLPLFVLALLGFRAWRPRLAPILMWTIWMAIWLAIYLPWIFTPEYYLLPLALGAALLGAQLVSWALETAQASSRPMRIAGWTTLALSGILWALTLPNSYTNGRLQLAIDSANAEMIAYLSAAMPEDSVVLINLPVDGEYGTRFPGIVETFGDRTDLAVGLLAAEDPESPARDGRGVALVLPVFKNEFYPSVRVGFYGHQTAAPNEAARELADGAPPVHRAVRTFRLFNVDAARLFCPVAPQIGYCAVPNTPFDRRLLEYGWEIYVIPSD